MTKEPRRHHYISQFYLKGFATKGPKNPPIKVINLREKTCFTTTSKNIAGIRDFNRIEIPGANPNMFEKILSDFETKAGIAIKEVHETMKFEGENRLIILELISMFATRNPLVRQNIDGILTDTSEKSIEMLLRNKKEFRDETISLIQKIDPQIKDDASIDDIKNFFKNNLKLEISTAYHIHTELIMHKPVFGSLANRKWTLLQSSAETGPFITSDNPVVLCWKNPDEVPENRGQVSN